MNIAIQAAHQGRFGSRAHNLGRWVDHVLGEGFHKYCPEESWSPPVNLYEDECHYCLVVDLAGVNAQTIDLHPEEGMLVLSGFRQTPELPEPTGEVTVLHMEIDHGQFCRQVPLPDDVDIDGIEAYYKQGFLWVQMPKKS